LIAAPLDYEVTVRLLAAPLENMIGGSLSEPAERFYESLLDAVKKTSNSLPVPFTNDQIRLHFPHLGRSTVGNHLSELEEKGYLEATQAPAVGRGRPPKAYRPTHRDVNAAGVLPSLEQLFGDIGAGETQMPEIPETAVSTPF
jgi:DNA-binding transcriptional ArsR family regulator